MDRLTKDQIKLCRYGERAAETPGLIDANGCLRDVSVRLSNIANDVVSNLEALHAIVIGKPGKSIFVAEAMDRMAGFRVCNDVSDRSYQIERLANDPKTNLRTIFGPIGRWLVTRDEVSEPQNLHMWRKVNGE